MFVRLKKAEVKVRDSDRARRAERGQGKPAESANREVTLERNAPRGLHYAARKSLSKRYSL